MEKSQKHSAMQSTYETQGKTNLTYSDDKDINDLLRLKVRMKD